MQRIVCAANKNKVTGEIVLGLRHCDLIMQESIQNHLDSWSFRTSFNELEAMRKSWRRAEQGFIDNKGQFLNRQQAWYVAQFSNQIVKRVGGDTKGDGCLYSENLY